MRVLDLGSYHAIVACVAAGTGVALVPESVLDDRARARRSERHPLPAVHAQVITPLIWRAGEVPAALAALQAELRPRARRCERRGLQRESPDDVQVYANAGRIAPLAQRCCRLHIESTMTSFVANPVPASR